MNGESFETLLVTGGAGFIGANFVHMVCGMAEAPKLVVVDKLTYAGRRESLAGLEERPGFCFEQGDITDRESLLALLRRHRPQAVVNFAAETHVDRSIDSAAPFIENNIAGVFSLLEACRAYRDEMDRPDQLRLLHISTDEVFGDLSADAPPATEHTLYQPSSPYAASKAAGDHLVHAWVRTYDMPLLLTNCSNNYGPFQFPEKLIPLMIIKCLSDEPLPIYGDGGQSRDWLYVADHCRALYNVLIRGKIGETFAIGGRAESTNLKIVQTLCDIMDRQAPSPSGRSYRERIQFVTDRPGHDRRYAIDPTKIETELGWSPSVDMKAGLEQTVRWYLNNRSWWQAILASGYGGERLGLQGGSAP